MFNIKDFEQINEYQWLIPSGYRKDMKVPVRLYVNRELLEQATDDLSIEQAINASTLPGIVGQVVVMPDMHQGYGFPIGGVAATKYPEGVISPGGIGYDINCGVRLLSTQITYEQAEPFLDNLAVSLNKHCPTGIGSESHIRLSEKELDQICREGSQWAQKRGYATELDIRRTEEKGKIVGADPNKVSDKAKKRGMPQLGTLGSGNHFIEVDIVDQIFDDQAANVMGLQEGHLAVMIHCGSRGFGHQICTDYVQKFQNAIKKYHINLPDRELVCAPLDSPEGQDYLAAMRSAANYAFCNRQVLAHFAGQAFEEVFAGKVKNWQLNQVYDIAHNMGKIETHIIEGEKVKVCVHRKGATRAFGPGERDIPDEYQKIGQPVLVPGSMGTASWVLVGTAESMEQTFGSCCHGAGRVMSRSKAKKSVWGEDLLKDLVKKGIHVQAGSMAGLAEEAPTAYKDVDMVIKVVAGANIARKVARLRPVVVVKG